MTKPVFGKWYTLAEATPKDGQVVLFKVKGQVLIGDYEITALNEELFTHAGVSYHAQEWMPLPKAGQDAFTELRARLDCMEHRSWHESFCGEEIPALKEVVLDLIREIREVIGE